MNAHQGVTVYIEQASVIGLTGRRLANHLEFNLSHIDEIWVP